MYLKDTLTIVTIPDYDRFSMRTGILDVYRKTFSDDIVFVVEKITNVLSAYIRQEFSLDINLQKGLNEDRYNNIWFYICDKEALSDVYSTLVKDFYKYTNVLCVDPGVLLFEDSINYMFKVPFGLWNGARLLATKAIKCNKSYYKTLKFQLSVLKLDVEKEIESDFSHYRSKKYKYLDYGVILSKREHLKNIGYFIEQENRNFICSALDYAHNSLYTTEYSHELYTYKLQQEGA